MRRVCLTQSRRSAEPAKKVRLGDVCQIEAGNSAPQNKSFYQKGEYPFVRTSDVGAIHFGVLESTRDLLNKNGIHGLRLFKSGGILFPKSGASTFLNHCVLLGMDAYVSSHLAIITPNSDFVDGHYLLHGLSTIDTKEIFPNTDYPSLRTSDIADITIRLPGLGFQKRIAAVLDISTVSASGRCSARHAALWVRPWAWEQTVLTSAKSRLMMEFFTINPAIPCIP